MGKTEQAALGKFVADGTLGLWGRSRKWGFEDFEEACLELWALGFLCGRELAVWRGGDGWLYIWWEGRRVWGDASLSSVVT